MLYLLVTLVCLLVLWNWFKKPDSTEPPDLPGKLPIIGHFLRLSGDSKRMFNFIKEISAEGLERGGVVKLYVGPALIYTVVDPEDCLTVTNSCIQKHYSYKFAKPFVTNGLLVADVATWKKHRRLLNPAFSQHVLDGFLDVFNSQTESLVRKFAQEVGKPFNQEDYIRINNLETVCATALGVLPDEYGAVQHEYLPLLEDLLNILNDRFKKFWLHSDLIYKFSTLKKNQDQIVERLHKFSDMIVQKKRSEMNYSRASENNSRKLKPFIDLITELGKDQPSMTDWQIRGEVSTVIVGGHDTVASAMSIAMTLLGSHPEVQEKAYQEILEVLGDSKKYVEKEDLSKFVYVEAIAKETLRLFPSVPVMGRQLDKDIKLKNCTLKAGYGCLINIYGSQRHPMWGPDANEFRPDRWLDKDTLPDAKYLAAFGMGRRTCIGKPYSMMAMKIMLAHIIRCYRIESDVSKMVIKMNAMIRPVEGFEVTLHYRQ